MTHYPAPACREFASTLTRGTSPNAQTLPYHFAAENANGPSANSGRRARSHRETRYLRKTKNKQKQNQPKPKPQPQRPGQNKPQHRKHDQKLKRQPSRLTSTPNDPQPAESPVHRREIKNRDKYNLHARCGIRCLRQGRRRLHRVQRSG